MTPQEWLDKYDLIDDWMEYPTEYDGEHGSGDLHDEF